MTEKELCEKLSQAELLDRIRENALFPLFPAVQVLVERTIIVPLRKRCGDCEGEYPAVVSCKTCGGDGIDKT